MRKSSSPQLIKEKGGLCLRFYLKVVLGEGKSVNAIIYGDPPSYKTCNYSSFYAAPPKKIWLYGHRSAVPSSWSPCNKELLPALDALFTGYLILQSKQSLP